MDNEKHIGRYMYAELEAKYAAAQAEIKRLTNYATITKTAADYHAQKQHEANVENDRLHTENERLKAERNQYLRIANRLIDRLNMESAEDVTLDEMIHEDLFPLDFEHKLMAKPADNQEQNS